MQKLDEKKILESLECTYQTHGSSWNCLIRSSAIRIFKPFILSGGDALELGCDDGYMSSLIAPLCKNLTVVDGSAAFIEMTRKMVSSKVKFVHSLFEEFSTSEKFDYIFATYVLEHVSDSISFLKNAANLLNENGLLFIIVPNARAMSRQLARHMGLIEDLFGLTQNDINHGHRRVYDRITLTRDIKTAGLHEISQGGLLYKPLADFQMDKMLDLNIIGDLQVEGLWKMGLEYPDFAGSLFSICARS